MSAGINRINRPLWLLIEANLKTPPAFYLSVGLTSALKDIPRLAREYQEAHRIVTQELQEKDKARGNKTMSMFEDGFGE